jgi:hypothetical protein
LPALDAAVLLDDAVQVPLAEHEEVHVAYGCAVAGETHTRREPTQMNTSRNTTTNPLGVSVRLREEVGLLQRARHR